jgi:hypothetical protein
VVLHALLGDQPTLLSLAEHQTPLQYNPAHQHQHHQHKHPHLHLHLLHQYKYHQYNKRKVVKIDGLSTPTASSLLRLHSVILPKSIQVDAPLDLHALL